MSNQSRGSVGAANVEPTNEKCAHDRQTYQVRTTLRILRALSVSAT